MGEKHTAEVLTVYNRPFIVNELLAAIRPERITLPMFEGLVSQSRGFDLSTMMTTMTRQVDISSFVPNLIGVSDNPQETLEVLSNQGHRLLLKIARMDPDLQDEIFETLRGSHRTTMRALLVLDEFQAEMVHHFTHIRQGSPKALALRQANQSALEELYRHPKLLHSGSFDPVIALQCRRALFKKEPRICYPLILDAETVVEVWQYFFMPDLFHIKLGAPYGNETVGQALDRITPHIYRRNECDTQRLEPQTPSGFVGLLGKVGGALPRLVAAQVKHNQTLRQKVMREEETARELYEFYSGQRGHGG